MDDRQQSRLRIALHGLKLEVRKKGGFSKISPVLRHRLICLHNKLESIGMLRTD